MSKVLRVEIIGPVHNRREITLQCLKSVSRLRTPDLDLHSVIVDDGSTDGTSEAIAAEFPEVEIIQGDGNLWYSEGTNVGIRAALQHDPDYILLINDDQVFDENSVRYLIETAERFPRSVVGPLLLLWDEPHKLFQTSPVWDTWGGGWRHWQQQTIWTVPQKPWHVEMIVGNCVLVPAAAFREAGLLDSKRYPNFADVEFTPRLRRQGWRLLVDPRARVFCQPNTPPPRVRSMTAREKFDHLLVDTGRAHNLRRRLRADLDTAPSKMKGLAAFSAFLGRTLIGKSIENAAPAEREPQL
ncbi:MAG: glycosyltransferase family 2 protein, partial [Acidobacteria bacterium]|nr:glycosyltransferase family 2 protein [Acidobacteriota bacterium]